MSFDEFIYGKDQTKNVVAVEVKGGVATLFVETEDGIQQERRTHDYWILYPEKINTYCYQLRGNSHYGWAAKYETREEFYQAKGQAEASGADYYCIYNQAEAHMVKTGVTSFLGMEPKDVSVLAFDIETTGLVQDDTSRVLLISNTLRKNGKIIRKMFSYDEYKSQKELIDAWCEFVRGMDPSVLVGHNIFGFDLPYLKHCAGGPLRLGRDRSGARFSPNASYVRKDGSQKYEYHNVTVFGRQVIDTFNLSIKYDVARNYPSNGLKAIIAHEGLERKDRQHYDAAKIKDNYQNPEEWAKIKAYAEHDGDDALALFDLMIPAYFYYAQTIPRGLQHIINSNSGAQVNSFMVRSYLANYHSIPKASQTIKYEGAHSDGFPGIYKNCFKVDVASLYPSIIRQYKVANTEKDPEGVFLKMVNSFTDQRLEHKRLAKETGERKYKDRSEAEKIMINSAYGFMNAGGLNFNSPEHAALVCKIGRRIRQRCINAAERNGYKVVNWDTDSFMVCDFADTEPKEEFLIWLNALFKDGITWEDDGYYESVIIFKAKNYVLKAGDKVTTKGNTLKATGKEPALKKFIQNTVYTLLNGGDENDILDLYSDVVRDIFHIETSNIADWCSKKTVTEAILKSQRTTEARIREAIQREGLVVQEGDKINVFFESDTKVTLKEAFDGTYDTKRLLGKLYSTIQTLGTVLDLSKFPNFTLKRNQKQLESLRQDTDKYYTRLSSTTAGLQYSTEGITA